MAVLSLQSSFLVVYIFLENHSVYGSCKIAFYTVIYNILLELKKKNLFCVWLSLSWQYTFMVSVFFLYLPVLLKFSLFYFLFCLVLKHLLLNLRINSTHLSSVSVSKYLLLLLTSSGFLVIYLAAILMLNS